MYFCLGVYDLCKVRYLDPRCVEDRILSAATQIDLQVINTTVVHDDVEQGGREGGGRAGVVCGVSVCGGNESESAGVE